MKLQDNPMIQALFSDLHNNLQGVLRKVNTVIQAVFRKYNKPEQLPWRISCYAGKWTYVSVPQKKWSANLNLCLAAFYDNEIYFQVPGGWHKEWKEWNQKYFPMSTRTNADEPRGKVMRHVFVEMLETERRLEMNSMVKEKKENKPPDQPPTSSTRSDIEHTLDPKQISLASDHLPFPTTITIPAASTHSYTPKDLQSWNQVNFLSQFLFYIFQELKEFASWYDVEHLFILWVENKLPKDLSDPTHLNFERVVTLFLEGKEINSMQTMWNEWCVEYMS
jgi:hypothetical protein